MQTAHKLWPWPLLAGTFEKTTDKRRKRRSDGAALGSSIVLAGRALALQAGRLGLQNTLEYRSSATRYLSRG